MTIVVPALRAAVAPAPWVKNELWRNAREVPALDQRFADDKSLIDTISGQQLITHTRASSGTYVGSDGLIKTATTNLLTYSEDFSNAEWDAITSATKVSATGVDDPAGGTTASTWKNDGTTSIDGGIRRTVSGTSGLTYTYSAWIRRRTGTGGISMVVGQNVSFDITSQVTSEWNRISVTNTADAVTRGYVFIETPGDEIDLWGAQLEQSSTVGEYVPTTSTINSAPRFDHDPVTGESLGLLVEESRTNLLTQSQELTASTGASVSLNAATSPLGTSTAVVVTEDNTNGNHAALTQAATVSAVATTCSFYGKPNGRSWVALRLGGINRAWFNLSTGQVGTTDAGTTATSVQAFPNGFYRCSCTFTPAAGAANIFFRMGSADGTDSYLGDNASGMILFGFQIEDGAFPTSYIPTTGSTVNRAADVASISGSNFGTFRTNLLTYSEEFDNAGGWASPVNSSLTSNALAAPNGSVTSEKLVVNNLASTGYVQSTNFSASLGFYCFSCFLKKGEFSTARIQLNSDIWEGVSLAARPNVVVDLNNGTVLSQARNSGYGILPLTNGWYRVYLVAQCTTASVSSVLVGCNDTGDGTSGIYIWGAQLEEGSTATDYIKSDVNFVSRASSATYYDANGVIQTAAVDEARTAAYLPDGNGNFVSAGPLLLENAGTNLLLQSEDFSTTWGLGNMRVFGSGSTVNAVIAPDGTLTADHIVEDTSTGNHNIGQTAAVVSGSTYSISIYAKAPAQSRQLQILVANTNFTVTPQAIFDASTGFVVSSVNGTASIVPFGNGWYRCQFITISATSSGSNGFNLRFYDGATNNYTGDDTSGLYLWGAQLEESSYPTSYIPTTSSTVTRAADVSTSAATTVFESDWYRQDEGSIFGDTTSFNSDASENTAGWGIDADDTTNQNRMWFYHTKNQYIGSTSGSLQYVSDFSDVQANVRLKSGFSYKENDIAASSNGLTPLVDTSATLPTVDRLFIGKVGFSGTELNGTIRRLTYWPTRLGNDTLQTITQ